MTGAEPSLCDRCRNPGKCCSHFALNFDNAKHDTELKVLIMMATATVRDAGGRQTTGLPFMPLYRNAEGIWRLWCPLLGRDGRCTDYAHRPDICAQYQPGQDPLCAEYDPHDCSTIKVVWSDVKAENQPNEQEVTTVDASPDA